MEPRIQYAQTTDGVSIAFYTVGAGMPYVLPPAFGWNHYEAEWKIAPERRWAERLAERYLYVRYDGRGSGLSDRDVKDLSLDSLLLDLEAVADHLGLAEFALCGSHLIGPLTIAYAVRHPDRVSRLVLWCTSARLPGLSPQEEALVSLMEKDWALFIQTFTHVMFGWDATGEPGAWAQYVQRAVSKEMFVAQLQARRRDDVSGLLPHVKCPTMVMERRERPSWDMALTRELASRIPSARLVLLEGGSPGPYDDEAAFRALSDFLSEGEEGGVEAAPLATEDVHTILFTDMEGSTALTERLGDARAQEVLRTHNSIIRDALKAHSGSETKHTGDGIMASFASASKALEAAISMQRGFAEHNEANPETPIRVRIGVNSGEPVAEDADLFGTAVQLAARICAQAQPGQILASNVVQELATGKGFTFTDKGEATLKGFEKPVRLHEVRWQESR